MAEPGAELLSEGKFYEYSQKMKLLANRRLQAGRLPEALQILQTAAAKLLPQNEVNEAYELIGKWLEVLEQNPEQYSTDRESTRASHAETIIQLFHLHEAQQRGPALERFMRKFGKQINQPTFCKLLAEEMLHTHHYSNSQRYAIHLPLDFGRRLLEAWAKESAEHETAMIYARFALLKLLHGKFDECKEVIQLIPKSPFKTLATHTLNAINIKSKAAFEAILKGYSTLLEHDGSFRKVFQSLAYQYFRIDMRDKSESLFDSLM